MKPKNIVKHNLKNKKLSVLKGANQTKGNGGKDEKLSIFSGWTKKYSLSKSLRFALKPVRETKTQGFLNEFIESDTQRDKDYKELKQIIDEYHKAHIEETLFISRDLFTKQDLEKFDSLWQKCHARSVADPSKNKTKDLQKELKGLQKSLRKQVSEHFKKSQVALRDSFSKNKDNKQEKDSNKQASKKSPLFEKELITEILPQWIKGLSYDDISHREDIDKQTFPEWREKSLKIVKKFCNFTVYLTGFHENRKNIYSDKEQATAISHRMVHENLPRFLSNKKAYKKISDKFPTLKHQIESIPTSDFKKELKELEINTFEDLFKPEFFNRVLSQTKIDCYNCIIGGKKSKTGEKIKGINEKINLFRQQEKKKLKANSKLNKNEKSDLIPFKPKNIPFFQPLFKQILSDRQSHSFYYEEFKNKRELLSALKDFWTEVSTKNTKHSQKKEVGLTNSIIQKVNHLFMEEISKDAFDPYKMYFEGSRLSALSHKLFGDWTVIESAFSNYAENAENAENKKLFSSKGKRDKWLKKDFFSFSEIHTALLFDLEREIELSPSSLLYPLLSYYMEKEGSSTNQEKGEKEDSASYDTKHNRLFSFKEIKQAIDFISRKEFESMDESSKKKQETKSIEGNILCLYFKLSLLNSKIFKITDLKNLSNEIFKSELILKTIKKSTDDKFYEEGESSTSQSTKNLIKNQELKNNSNKTEPFLEGSFSFNQIYQALLNKDKSKKGSKTEGKTESKEEYIKGEGSAQKFFQSIFFNPTDTTKDLLNTDLHKLYQEVEGLYTKDSNSKASNLEFSTKESKSIQKFLSSFMDIFYLLKPLKGSIKNQQSLNLLDRDQAFYNELDILYEKLQSIIPLFNKCRNFISQNKNRLKKIKINFENAELLDGWDVNKETAYRSILLRKKVSSQLKNIELNNNSQKERREGENITSSQEGTPLEELRSVSVNKAYKNGTGRDKTGKDGIDIDGTDRDRVGRDRADRDRIDRDRIDRDRADRTGKDGADKEDQYNYYLGVMRQDHKDMFDYHLNFEDSQKPNDKIKNQKLKLKESILCQDERDIYEKMNYKLLPGPDKMLPKVFFSEKNLDYFKPSSEILRIKQEKTYTKNDGAEFKLSDCHKLIDFYKESIKKHHDWRQFDFQFSHTKDYKDMSDFFHEVSSQGYKLSFDKIRADYIDKKVKQGELYLFQIYNKDFSLKKKSKGRDNLHTSYFKMLFNEKNLEDIVFKLSGQAEMFFRKASLKKEQIITHPAKQPIKNKNPLNTKRTSTFSYDLIKDKRFTEDKFFLHIPVVLNFKQGNIKAGGFNQEVLKFLNNNPKVNIIGIDRGERNLAYYTVINQERKILSQGSFNQIETKYTNIANENQEKDKHKNKGKAQGRAGDISMSVDYHSLLDKKEKERDKSRKSWNKLDSIKNLKAGYLSQLVYKISQLMIKHNAIVVFEDLNRGFKRGRMKFEKQVYQKLEKALIDKLNYLVFKDKGLTNSGGVLKAFQLSAPFESFQKMRKQTGFIFYVPAYYTSKADPLTGFVNLIYPRYENITKAKDFFSKFESIYFDNQKNYFVFKYQDNKINPRRKSESQHLWTVCSQGLDRYRYDRKIKKHKKINVTQELKNLFNKHDIDYSKGKELKQEIIAQNDKKFFWSLIESLKLILQLRHINLEAQEPNERDFILSPVADPKGRFFDSRKVSDEQPKNADANGAYHIALRGLQMLSHIKEDDRLKFKLPSISNKDWFDFIRKNHFPINKKTG